MKLTIEEIESVVNHLSNAVTYAKAAERTAKLIHADQREVSFDLKIAYEDVKQATRMLETWFPSAKTADVRGWK